MPFSVAYVLKLRAAAESETNSNISHLSINPFQFISLTFTCLAAVLALAFPLITRVSRSSASQTKTNAKEREAIKEVLHM